MKDSVSTDVHILMKDSEVYEEADAWTGSKKQILNPERWSAEPPEPRLLSCCRTGSAHEQICSGFHVEKISGFRSWALFIGLTQTRQQQKEITKHKLRYEAGPTPQVQEKRPVQGIQTR